MNMSGFLLVTTITLKMVLRIMITTTVIIARVWNERASRSTLEPATESPRAPRHADALCNDLDNDEARLPQANSRPKTE